MRILCHFPSRYSFLPFSFSLPLPFLLCSFLPPSLYPIQLVSSHRVLTLPLQKRLPGDRVSGTLSLKVTTEGGRGESEGRGEGEQEEECFRTQQEGIAGSEGERLLSGSHRNGYREGSPPPSLPEAEPVALTSSHHMLTGPSSVVPASQYSGDAPAVTTVASDNHVSLRRQLSDDPLIKLVILQSHQHIYFFHTCHVQCTCAWLQAPTCPYDTNLLS